MPSTSDLALRTIAATIAGLLASGGAVAAEAPVAGGASQVAITLTGDNGGACGVDYDSAKAGPITFSVTNRTATALTEVELLSQNRILGEKENLAPGLPTVSFTVTLGGGAYQIYCPGAASETVAFTVTGAPAPRPVGGVTAILEDGTKGYANYVRGIADAMLTAVDRLKADIDAGDLEQARIAYAKARPFYERIESDVEGFVLPGHDVTDNAGNLDYLIDMRASNLDPDVGWHGFHAVERDLFEAGEISDGTRALAAELRANIARLVDVAKDLVFLPEDLANGAASLLEEVQANKISGEEEAYSHLDLLDFAGNVEGARQAFAFLKPGMTEIDPELTTRVDDQFSKVEAILETYRDPAALGGYKAYTEALRGSDAAGLSRAIQALQEPLARIAEKVATAQ